MTRYVLVPESNGLYHTDYVILPNHMYQEELLNPNFGSFDPIYFLKLDDKFGVVVKFQS